MELTDIILNPEWLPLVAVSALLLIGTLMSLYINKTSSADIRHFIGCVSLVALLASLVFMSVEVT